MKGIKKAILFAAVISLNINPVFADPYNPRETPVVKVVRENTDAVVNISTERLLLLRENPAWGAYGSEFDDFFQQFYGPMRAMKFKGVGSGVVLDKDGIIVTNAHVVNMTSNVIVIFNDGTQAEGQVMYEDSGKDLAIIKINPPKPLKTIKLGSTEDIMIGEPAIAIGDPMGLENSVTAGVISGKGRKLFSQKGGLVGEDLIQTDTPINPGNSGGALLNINGELIGINLAIVQNSQSIGFAIPVEKVKSVLEAYKSNKNPAVKRNTRTVMRAVPPRRNMVQMMGG